MGDSMTPNSPAMTDLVGSEVEYVVIRPELRFQMKVYQDLVKIAQKGDFPPPQVANLIQDLVVAKIGEAYGAMARQAAEHARPAPVQEAPVNRGRPRTRTAPAASPVPPTPILPVEGMEVRPREIKKPAGKKKPTEKKVTKAKKAGPKKPAPTSQG